MSEKKEKKFTIHLCNRLFINRDVKMDLFDLRQNLDKVSEESKSLIYEIAGDSDANSIFYGDKDASKLDAALLSRSVVTLVGMLLDVEGKFTFSEFFITKELARKYLLRVVALSKSSMLWENLYDSHVDFSECENVTVLSQQIDDITNEVNLADFSGELRTRQGIDDEVYRKRYRLYQPFVSLFKGGAGNCSSRSFSNRVLELYSRCYPVDSHINIVKEKEYDDFFVETTSDFFYCEGKVNMTTDVGSIYFEIDNALALINALLTIYDMEKEDAVLQIDLDDESSLSLLAAVLIRIYNSPSLMWAWEHTQIVFIDSSGILEYLPRWYDVDVMDLRKSE